jgi:hypothetical protein
MSVASMPTRGPPEATDASLAGDPPSSGTFIKVPLLTPTSRFIQYTFAESTTMPSAGYPVANVRGAPPSSGAFTTVPLKSSTQYAVVESMTSDVANPLDVSANGAPPSSGAFVTPFPPVQ